MIEIGRIVVKIAGRDAGKKAVIIDKINDDYVIIDGQTRRKKVNIKHIEPLDRTIKLNKNSQHEEVVAELKKIGIDVAKKSDKVRAEKPAKKAPAKAAEKKPDAKAKKAPAKK